VEHHASSVEIFSREAVEPDDMAAAGPVDPEKLFWKVQRLYIKYLRSQQPQVVPPVGSKPTEYVHSRQLS
jgi:hypothetical protein